MDRLPSVDEHRIRVQATPDRAWDAVLRCARTSLTKPAPAPFVALWRLEPVSGFAVAEEDAPRRLALRGRHRFSEYELAFDVEKNEEGVTVSARTSAVFPGASGRVYRALVIGSGGHGILVRRMLRTIARVAERAA